MHCRRVNWTGQRNIAGKYYGSLHRELICVAMAECTKQQDIYRVSNTPGIP